MDAQQKAQALAMRRESSATAAIAAHTAAERANAASSARHKVWGQKHFSLYSCDQKTRQSPAPCFCECCANLDASPGQIIKYCG